jgi:uncharacterized repeat protein (TIGR02543 family)
MPGSVLLYGVTVNGSNLPSGTMSSQSGAGFYATGSSVTIRAGSINGFTFTGWTVNAGGVTLTSVTSATTTFTMPANAVTVTANWTSGILYGDLNGDGVIDNADLILMIRYINTGDSTGIDLATVDVNGDGVRNDDDLTLFLRYFARPGIVLGPQS